VIFGVTLTIEVDVPVLDNVVEYVDVVEPVIVLELVTVFETEADDVPVFDTVAVDVRAMPTR
jgi:hypothetical protein